MDTDWCLTCGRQITEGGEAYCSKTCMTLDRTSLVQSLPIRIPSYRPSFDLPYASPPRRPPQTRHLQARACVSDGFPRENSQNKARFRDDELQDAPNSFIARTYAGKDREGILVWAHAVFPGLQEECAPPAIETASMTDLDKFLTRPPPFPLTAQNLAPPCVTVAPRHVLLNHTSFHSPSHPEDPTVPSVSQDDASLLTPATESVITPSAPDLTTLSSSKPFVGRVITKVCSWIAVVPSRIPRGTPEGKPPSPSVDDCVPVHSDQTMRCHAPPFCDKPGKSSAGVAADLSLASATHSRARLPDFGRGELYESDAA